LQEIIKAYHEQYKEVDAEYEDLGGESKIKIEVPGLPIPVVGKIDRMLRHKETQKCAAIEWKFSTSTWGYCGRPNNQLVGYAVGASEKLGEPVWRVLFRLNGVHISSKDGLVSAKRKADPPRSIFTQDVVDFDTWDIEEWYKDMREKYALWCALESQGYFPKNTRSCGNFGGCSFGPLCVAPENMRETFAQCNFDVKPEDEWERS